MRNFPVFFLRKIHAPDFTFFLQLSVAEEPNMCYNGKSGELRYRSVSENVKKGQ